MIRRVAYLSYDGLGNIVGEGVCLPIHLPIPNSQKTTVIIDFTHKLLLDSIRARNAFVSDKVEDFDLLFQDNDIFVYEKKSIRLKLSKDILTINSEHITITHDAPVSLRLWRDLHQPLIPTNGGLVHPKKGIKLTASIPGLYTIRVKHPRYKAEPIQLRAVLENERG